MDHHGLDISKCGMNAMAPVRHVMMVAMVVANGFILTVCILWDLCCLKMAEFAVCCWDRSIRRGSTASAVDLFE